ncbi:hypothetical protein J437_LFUL001743 [Ladona fulva]|uniref:Uncharacterized protein n=1 Tax=Ladona fulva TaxID=123851 RepID=A0A8K0NZL0_LADFU|nr:hypothetical protein J437_LFUL001743 [Ladona fulva]
MATLNLYSSGSIQSQFCDNLLKTLPSNFEVCLFTNSGAEANDLALQLARRYTGCDGVAVLENAFHGAVKSVIEISPAALQRQNLAIMPWVHVLPYPDTYRSPSSPSKVSESEIVDTCFHEAKSILDKARKNGAKIGCFVSETILVIQGVIVPPRNWLSKIYSYIRQIGGLVIADEIQTGMGRCGSHFWGFQSQGVIPDIITIGKPIGNGYPIAAVVTSRSIAQSIQNLHEEYLCCSVAAAVGKSVLDVLHEEKLMMNAEKMGHRLREGLHILKHRHRWIGDVRGIGMITGLEIVWCKEEKRPAPEVTEKICYRLREEHILAENGGVYGNVVIFVPPLCLSVEDVTKILDILNKIFCELEVSESEELYQLLGSQSESNESSSQEYRWQENLEGVIAGGSSYYSLD